MIRLKYFLKISVIIFVLINFIFCNNYGTNEQISRKKIITEFYYKKWDFEKDKGQIRISPEDVSYKGGVYFLKTDPQGNRVIQKGFFYNGVKQDFWTYYDLDSSILKIEFYVNDKVTQEINYD